MNAYLNLCGDAMLVVFCLWFAWALTGIGMIGWAAFTLFWTALLIGESLILYDKRKKRGHG